MNTTSRQQRRRRIRAKIAGTAARPRVSIHRSNRYLTAQLIDDTTGATLGAATSRGLSGSKVEQATAVGQQLADAAKKAGIDKAVFDRAGFKYHGRVKAVADGLRAGGLQL